MNDFIRGFKSRWLGLSRTHSRFVNSYTECLKSKIFVKSKESKRGRRELSFKECGVDVKLKKTKTLRESTLLPKFAYATQTQLRKCGNINASKIAKAVAVTSRTTATCYKNIVDKNLEIKNTENVIREKWIE